MLLSLPSSNSKDWRLPLYSCLAVGGQIQAVMPACLALVCIQVSIIIIDDMLDKEPVGHHVTYGVGEAANFAAALQALAIDMIDEIEVSAETKLKAALLLSRMTFDTALGQQLDTQNLQGEDNYWEIVEAKSTPFYKTALQLGAIIGGADEHTISEFGKVGIILGKLVQIQDDREDVFKVPANPDWLEGRNNLLILFAATHNHPKQARFNKIRYQAHKQKRLIEAQEIIATCGAIGYTYELEIAYLQEAISRLRQLELATPGAIIDTFEERGQTIATNLSTLGEKITLEDILAAQFS